MGWRKLERAYRSKGLVLALGAGVSMGSRLPSWRDLLQSLTKVCLGDGVLFKDMDEAGFSYPTIAGILEGHTPAGHTFPELVRDRLYEEFPFYPQAPAQGKKKALREFVETNNPTLRAVGALCALPVADEKDRPSGKDDDRPWCRPNPHIHAIVNFNIDHVLQKYVRACFKNRVLRTIERPSASSRRGFIPVYHMHGLLRYDRKRGRREKEADSIVLTERDYFDFFNRPTSLFNYTFLHLLREHPCLFIGLSMQDDNIRRLLHYSRQERIQSALDEGKEPSEAERKALRHFAILPRSKVGRVDDLKASALASLGTRVLWLESFAEIPRRLGELLRSGADL